MYLSVHIQRFLKDYREQWAALQPIRRRAARKGLDGPKHVPTELSIDQMLLVYQQHFTFQARQSSDMQRPTAARFECTSRDLSAPSMASPKFASWQVPSPWPSKLRRCRGQRHFCIICCLGVGARLHRSCEVPSCLLSGTQVSLHTEHPLKLSVQASENDRC